VTAGRTVAAEMPSALPTLLAALAIAPFGGASHASEHSSALLPDLAQDPPGQVSVQQVAGANGTEFRLGFRSAVRNVGKGPLIIRGHRLSASAPMRADQVVRLAGGASRTYRNVIPMHYAYEQTHNHFHVLHFDRYSLRDPQSGARVRPDHKSGFCLGDREPVRLPRPRPLPVYGPETGECDFGRPQALHVLEGLTPGYLDDYGPQLEGQYIDITGVPAGRYSLVHRVNADHRIRERNLGNDVAAALIDLQWPSGQAEQPVVTVLARCRRSARCAVSAARASARRAVPVLSAAETSRFRLWCSLVHPGGAVTASAARTRRARLAESRRAWLAALRRANR
jgi:Lysyl oxidase